MNNYKWNSQAKPMSKAVKVLEVSDITPLAAQLKVLSKKINSLSLSKPMIVMACKTYGRGHIAIDCLIVGVVHGPSQQLDFIGCDLQPQGTPSTIFIDLERGIIPTFHGTFRDKDKSQVALGASINIMSHTILKSQGLVTCNQLE